MRPREELLIPGAIAGTLPEGTRGTGEHVQPFKAGLHHLAMPKGLPLPIPLLCSVAFGSPVRCEPGESKAEFLERMRRMELGEA